MPESAISKVGGGSIAGYSSSTGECTSTYGNVYYTQIATFTSRAGGGSAYRSTSTCS
jgi:hypothetical protein